MGLFDDLPNATVSGGLFDDLPDVSETVPTPGMPSDPALETPSLASVMVPSVDAQAMPIPAMPAEVDAPISALFSNTAIPSATSEPVDPAAASAVKGIWLNAKSQMDTANQALIDNPEMGAEQRQRVMSVMADAQQQMDAYQPLVDMAGGVDPIEPPINKPGTIVSRTAKATGQALDNVPENLLTGWHGMRMANAELGQDVSESDISQLERGTSELEDIRGRLSTMQANLSGRSENNAANQQKYQDLKTKERQLTLLYGDSKEAIQEEQSQLMRYEEAGRLAKKGIKNARDTLINIDAEPGSPEYYIAHAIGSSTEMAPALAVSMLTRSPIPAMVFMGGYSGGTSYVQGREEGLTPGEARGYATLNALAEGIPEALPVSVLIKQGIKPFTRIVAGAATEGVQEILTEAMQAGIDKGYIKPDMTWEEARNRMIDAGIIGTISGGVLAGGVNVAEAGVQKAINIKNRDRSGPDDLETPSAQQEAPDAPPISQTSVETLAPVQSGDEAGSQGSEVDPQTRRDGPPERPQSPDIEQDLPRVDTGSERTGNLTAAPPIAPQEDLNAEEPAPTEPTPAGEAPAPRPERRATIYTPENDPVEVEYQVVEADSVLTSDQAGFDQGAQPRDRAGNKNSEIQIEGIANNPTFARLNRAPETDRGAPVVGADGLVESGNGRTIGLRRAYERGTADAYRQALEAEYPEAAGMRNPIIIARRLSDVDRNDFAYRSNKPATQALSATEEARAEARMVDRDVLSLYRGGPVMGANNRDMVRKLISRLPATDQNRMINKDGGLTADGQRRVQAAIFSRAYDDPALLDRMASSVDDDMKNVTSVLTDLAPRVAKMRDAMERGEVAAEGDFIPALTEAIGQIANMRSRGENLADFKAQIDAFAAPLSQTTQTIMDAMFNEAGTHMASKKDMVDFIGFAIDAAEAQDTTTETLPGVEPVPPKTASEIVSDAKRKTQDAPPDQGALLESADGTGRRPRKSGPKKQQRADDQGRAEDAGDQGSVRDAAAARVGRRPPGRLSPTFLNFSYTNKPSVFDHAFVAAGVDPSEARLMPMDKQIGIVRKAIEDTFGVKVELPTIKVHRRNLAGRKVVDEKTSLQSRKALDQMLNAYRQLQMLAHVMGMPEKAVGLPIEGVPLTLSLVKGKHLRGALGMFSWGNGKRTISLADMSNSFAHEWGHALDHYLAVQSQKPFLKGMLSRKMAKDGVMHPLSPRRALTEAYAHVMWSMFGDSSAAGQIVLNLQVESAQLGADGKPTPKAKRAQKILTDIREGRTPPKEYWSTYFQTSAEFDRQVGGDGYFTDPAEMFARAFEAMIGHQVAQISDQPQAFLSKGEWAYSDRTDPRTALTFPKDIDLAQFTLAMRNLQHAMSRINLHGTDAPANAPETHDIMTTRHLLTDQKQSPFNVLSQRESQEWARTLDLMGNMPATLKQKGQSIVTGVQGFYSHMLRTTAATLYATADRQTTPEAKAAFTNIAKMVGKRPGNGKLIESIWEENVRRKAAVNINKIDGSIKRALAKKDVRRLNDENIRALRKLLVGDKVEASDGLRTLASELRGILNDIWYDLDSAGVEMGYASNYLPHRYDPDAATAKPDKFRAQAAKVYDIMFSREISDNEDSASQIADMKSIFNGLQKAVRAMPDGDTVPAPRLSDAQSNTVETFFASARELAQAQKRLKKVTTDAAKDRWQEKIDGIEAVIEDQRQDALDILRQAWAKYSAEKWLTKVRTGNLDDYGSIGPTASFLKGRILPKEAGSLMAEFMEENPVQMITSYAFDAARRSEYAKAFGANNEKLENMLMAAEGASREDVELMKQGVAAATGRVNRQLSGLQNAKTTMFTLGTMSMLSRAALTSLPEPITAGLRSGQVRDSFRAMIEFFRNIPPSQRKRELHEIARTIGLIMPYAQDTLMQNRMGMDVLNNKNWLAETVGRFFILNGLTPLTHYQRVAILPVANAVVRRHLQKDRKGGSKFSDGELNELGIAKEDRADLLEWMDSVGGMPSPEDLFGPDGDFHKAAELWSRAVYRFDTETIQDTLKSDRAMAANDPNHTALYGIMSFIDAFTRNVIFRTLERGMKDGDGTLKKSGIAARNAALVAPQIALLLMAQAIVGVAVMSISNPDYLDTLEDESDFLDWLLYGADRAGLTGRLQPFVNMLTGLRYNTDMTSMFAGPYPAYFANNMQRVLTAAVGRNSENTNTSEFSSAEGIWRLFVKTPLTALIAGTAPGGPISSKLATAGIGYLSLGTTEDAFAEALVGEKGSKHVGDPPWWDLGD